TWDATYFYVYLERYGTGAPWAYFQVYLDTNYDGLEQTGEQVLFFRMNSIGTSIDVNLDTYSSGVPAGDPLQDAQSKADGYRMPGSLVSGPSLNPDARGA